MARLSVRVLFHRRDLSRALLSALKDFRCPFVFHPFFCVWSQWHYLLSGQQAPQGSPSLDTGLACMPAS